MVAVSGGTGRASYPGGVVVPSAAYHGHGVKELIRGSRPAVVPGPCVRVIAAVSAAGLVHQPKIGSDPVGRLPVAMPGTISAAGQLRRSGCPPAIRRQVGDLLLTLATVECYASLGRPVPAPPALLRDLVIITARLAGRIACERHWRRKWSLAEGGSQCLG